MTLLDDRHIPLDALELRWAAEFAPPQLPGLDHSLDGDAVPLVTIVTPEHTEVSKGPAEVSDVLTRVEQLLRVGEVACDNSNEKTPIAQAVAKAPVAATANVATMPDYSAEELFAWLAEREAADNEAKDAQTSIDVEAQEVPAEKATPTPQKVAHEDPYTHEALFAWLAERIVADEEAKNAQTTNDIEVQEVPTENAEETQPLFEASPEETSVTMSPGSREEILKNFEKDIADVVRRQRADHQQESTNTTSETVATEQDRQVVAAPSIATHGYAIPFDRFTTKYRFPFGKKIAARNEAYRFNYPKAKPGRLWQKLATTAPKTEHEMAVFMSAITERTTIVDQLIRDNKASAVDYFNINNRKLLVLHSPESLATLANNDPQTVKTLLERKSANMQLIAGPEDIRDVNVTLSEGAFAQMSPMARGILKRFPRLGAKLLKNQ